MTDTYRVKKSQFSPLDPSSYIDIEVGGINTSATDLALVGRTREYGEIYNENILHLLENFASSEVPDTQSQSIFHAVPAVLINPTDGQCWFNTSRKIPYTYFRGRWLPLAYNGHIASNWGTVTNGTALPRPVGSDGYVFPYAECAWIVAPAYIPEEIRGMLCTVNPMTGVVTSTYYDETGATKPFEVFYQIIGVRSNDLFGGGEGSTLRVLLNRSLQTTRVPPISAFPRTITSASGDSVTVSVGGVSGGNTLRYTWSRVSPSTSQGFPPGYLIEPTSPTSASTSFRVTVTSPGVFNSNERITRGATFVCLVEELAPGDVVVESKLSLPVRVEFSNF